jgi:hypothetical protein
VVKWLFASVHEAEFSILSVVFLFLRDRNDILIKFTDSYFTDSTRTPSGLDKDSVPIVHMDRSMWTGLQVNQMWTGKMSSL